MWLNASDSSEASLEGTAPVFRFTVHLGNSIQKPLTTHTSLRDQPGLGRVLDVPFSLLFLPARECQQLSVLLAQGRGLTLLKLRFQPGHTSGPASLLHTGTIQILCNNPAGLLFKNAKGR